MTRRANENRERIALSWPEQEKEGAVGFTKYIFDWVSDSLDEVSNSYFEAALSLADALSVVPSLFESAT